MEDCETKPQTGQKREGKRHAINIDVPVVYVSKCSVMSVDKGGLLRGRTAPKKPDASTAAILVIKAIQCQPCLAHRQSVPLVIKVKVPEHLNTLTAC